MLQNNISKNWIFDNFAQEKVQEDKEYFMKDKKGQFWMN